MDTQLTVLFQQAQKADDPVGVSIIKNEITVYVPQTFRIETDLVKRNKDILQLLNSISFGCKKSKELGNSNSILEGSIWPFESYIWLINDYVENGYYYDRETHISNSIKGKIDWKRTMKTIPYLNDGVPVYTNFYSSSIKSVSNQITEIYKYCLNISLKRIGWLFNYNARIEYQLNLYASEMRNIVYRQLNATFDDVKRIRLQHMIHILDNILDDDTLADNHTFVVNNYEDVFEILIDELLGNVKGENKKIYNPKGYWNVEGYTGDAKSSLRVDTIHNIINNDIKTTIIVDAKLYSYGMTKKYIDLPATDSIQKQITYGEHVKNVVEKGNNIEIRNVFISPYNKENNLFNTNENFHFYGNAKGGWRDNKHDYETIIGILIDFNYLLDEYRKNTELIDLYTKIIGY